MLKIIRFHDSKVRKPFLLPIPDAVLRLLESAIKYTLLLVLSIKKAKIKAIIKNINAAIVAGLINKALIIRCLGCHRSGKNR